MDSSNTTVRRNAVLNEAVHTSENYESGQAPAFSPAAEFTGEPIVREENKVENINQNSESRHREYFNLREA